MYRLPSDPIQRQPYSVALVPAYGFPLPMRIAAEVRFAHALEQSLGDADQVARTFQAWITASESLASDLDLDTIAMALRWPRASDLARKEGIRELRGVAGVQFEIVLAPR